MVGADAAARAALPAGMVGADAAAMVEADGAGGADTGPGGTGSGSTPAAAAASAGTDSSGAPGDIAVDGPGADGPGSAGEPAGAGAAGGGAPRRAGVKTDGEDGPLPASAGALGPDPIAEILGSGSVCASGSSLRPSRDGGRYSRRSSAGGGGAPFAPGARRGNGTAGP